MRVILKQDVPNLGRAGDIKDVKPGYARNYLIPGNMVMPATARSQKEAAFLEKVQERKIQKRKKTAEETAKAIEGKEIRITVKVGEGKLFGSVTNILVSRALEAEGFPIDKKLIQVDDPIKTLGFFDINIKFYEGITSQIKLIVQDEEGNTELAEVEEDDEVPPEAEAESTESETAETETPESTEPEKEQA